MFFCADWKQRKLKKSNVVSLKAYKGLAEIAVKCLCELLVALPHFNFHNNIIVLIVPLMNDASKTVSDFLIGKSSHFAWNIIYFWALFQYPCLVALSFTYSTSCDCFLFSKYCQYYQIAVAMEKIVWIHLSDLWTVLWSS